MKNKFSHIELIDLADGTIDRDRRIELEEAIRRSPELQQKFDEIRKTTDLLQQFKETSPTPQYFQNFIPQLRKRLDNGTVHLHGWIPSWLAPVAAPAVAVIIIGTISMLYSVLHPDAGDNIMHSIVRQADQSDLDNTDTYPMNKYYDDMEYTLIDAETAVEQTLIAGGISVSQTLNEYEINDERMMIQLNEQDVDLIVAYLNDRAVQ